MRKINTILLAIILLVNVLPTNGLAQENKILQKLSVSLTDMVGKNIKNATVFASVSGERAVSDEAGGVVLNVSPEDYLVITCDGYEKQVIEVHNGVLDNKTIKLQAWGSINPDKKITISNGSLPFSRITGSVERITGEELSDYPTFSVIEALAGRLSGVISSLGSTSPETESFGSTVRGTGFGVTYQDGVPSDLVETPDEIDEIIVAKDFGTSFLYGGGASNGALIVNSKKGNNGEKLMTFKVRTGVRNPVFLPNMMDAATYAQSFNTALMNDGLPKFYTPEAIQAYKDGSDPVRYPNHDYYQELVNDVSTYQHVTGNFSGGGKAVKYFSHLGYYGTDGVESVGNGNNLTRLRIKNNVEVDLNEYGKISLGIGGSFIKRKSPLLRGDGLFSTIYSYPANAMPYMINDSLYAKSSDYGRNLLVDLAHGSELEDVRRDGYSRLALDLDLSEITEGLSFNSTVSMYIYNNISQRLDPKVDMAEPIFTKTAAGLDTMILRNFSKGAVDTEWSKAGDRVDRNQYISTSLNYDRTFNENHALTANLLYAQRTENGNTYYQEYKERNIGLRTNYFYKQKYVLDLNLMNIGVRQLEKDERGKIFYSLGAAWLAHKESFLQDVEWLDFLKVRANYGVTGIPFNIYFMDITQYGGGSNAGTFGINGKTSGTGGYSRLYTGGENYKFPKKAYLNIGADFEMFASKLSGQVNYFNVRNYDMLDIPSNLYAILSADTDYLPYINYEDYESGGFDGRLTYRNSIGDFRYTVDANAMYRTSSYNKLNRVQYPEAENDRNLVGNKGGRIIGLEADGIFQNQAEIDAHVPQMFGETKPGDIRYIDYNKDGQVDEKDYHEIGHTPRLYYGVNFRLGYKNWNLSVHGDGIAFGDMVYNENTNKLLADYPAEMAKSWPVSNELPRLSTFNQPNNTRASTFWMRKAGYFNLRSVNLSYSFSQDLIGKTLLKEATIYVAGKNLAVLSSVDDMYIPSPNKGTNDAPALNAFELGLQVSF